MDQLLSQIKSCTICKSFLPNEPKPIIRASHHSKILIIGQAPGQKVQNSGIPWDDLSGKALIEWLGVNSEQFYDTNLFAIMPMGMCYPGTSKSGDLPPRKECAPNWHQKVIEQMPEIQLTLLIGKYAQDYYLGKLAKENLTETVKNHTAYFPNFIPLPHPSPRNNIWMKNNQWFAADVVPYLQYQVKTILSKEQ